MKYPAMRNVTTTRVVLSIICILCAVGPAAAVTVDHAGADATVALPNSTMMSVGGQNWYFMHASVGANMVDGMEALALESPERYLLAFTTVDDVQLPPGDTGTGTVFENDRGNPSWATKFLWFEEAVQNLGWREPAVNVVMNKLCFIDWSADPQAYVQSMAGLEAEFPVTVFVYTTMPITTGTDSDNVQRALYNAAVRTYCSANGRLLFDIADIESHDPDGILVTFTYNNQVYPRLYSGYTADGGHLNVAGARRVALGWYATAATITEGASGIETLPAPGATIASVFPNPFNPQTTIAFELPRQEAVSLCVFDVTGRLVKVLVDGDVYESGRHEAVWNGRDDGGSTLASGTYFTLLEAGAFRETKKIVLLK